MNGRTVLVVVAILSTGLMAGLLYGWVVSVIPGLARVSDTEYVSTMQSINRAIINPAFVIPFIATPAILGGAALLELRAGNSRRAWCLIAAAATYTVGVIGVTAGGNIPLNNALDAFDPAGLNVEALAERRTSYQGSWNRWHNLRTAAAVAAFSIAITSALVTTESD